MQNDDSGQAMMEYAIIIALVALVVIAVISILGIRVQNVIDHADDCLDPGPSGAPSPECAGAAS